MVCNMDSKIQLLLNEMTISIANEIGGLKRAYTNNYHCEKIFKKISINKQTVLETVRHYYRDNIKIIELKFEKYYRSNEAINWCCHFPFLALRFHSKVQLNRLQLRQKGKENSVQQ